LCQITLFNHKSAQHIKIMEKTLLFTDGKTIFRDLLLVIGRFLTGGLLTFSLYYEYTESFKSFFWYTLLGVGIVLAIGLTTLMKRLNLFDRAIYADGSGPLMQLRGTMRTCIRMEIIGRIIFTAIVSVVLRYFFFQKLSMNITLCSALCSYAIYYVIKMKQDPWR